MEARCEPLVLILISLTLYPLFGIVGVCAALLFFLLLSCFRCLVRLAAAPAPARARVGAGQGVLGPAGADLQQQHDAQRDVILALCATLPLADAVALRALIGGDGARNGEDYAGLQLLDTLWGSRAIGAPPPLAAAAVDALSSRPGTPSDGPCAVCLDPVAPLQPVTALPCLHVFHAHCIRTWLLESAACPVCRFKFVESA